jgi:hypothetical protein
VLLLSVVPVLAAPPPHANGHANGQETGNGGNSGNASQGGKPEGSPQPPHPANAVAPGPKDQNEAQKAVEEHRALPLAKIIKIAEGRDKGEVINARLVRVSGVLLYQLTLLDDAGNSWRVYYHALRGNPVVLP